VTTDLAAILRQLEPPARLEGELRYRVRPVPDTGHYFGRDSQSRPCLLLDSRDHSRRTPIRLALLEVQFAVPFRILDDDGSERTQTLTSIICRTTDDVVAGYFAHVAQAIVTIVGRSPTSNEVAQAVQRLTELFQNLSRPTGRSVLGLFAELLAIHVSGDPRVALSAWRSTVDDRYDFSVDNVRLEVKSTSDRIRAHYFSREQCMPPDGTVALLLSVFVERSGGGLSVGELIERIERQLAGDAELMFRLHATVAATMGTATAEALLMRFDEQLARGSMRLYELIHIPAVRDELPVGVSQVRFRADISQAIPADRPRLDQQSTTVRALLPG
jgi:hypothetical protein